MLKIKVIKSFGVALVSLLCIMASTDTLAQAWPSKPIRLVVPFPPGGPVDTLGRLLATRLTASLGQTVIVDNVGGANGALGMGQVARAKPDGYTVGLAGPGSQVFNTYLYSKLPYASPGDFTPVSLVAGYTNILVVNASLPVHSLPELIAYAKAHPDRTFYGSAGNGSSNHLCASDLASRTGIKASHVPYKGSNPALMGLMAGETTFMFDVAVSSMPQVRAGKLRVLASTGANRDKHTPDLPSVAETVPGFEFEGWFGLLGPAGMPDEVSAKLSREIASLSQSTEIMNSMIAQGYEFVGSTPAQFRERIERDFKKFEPIIKASGVRLD